MENVNTAPSEMMQGQICNGAFRTEGAYFDIGKRPTPFLAQYTCQWNLVGMGAQTFQLHYRLQLIESLHPSNGLEPHAPMIYEGFVNIALGAAKGIFTAGPGAGSVVESAIHHHGYQENADKDRQGKQGVSFMFSQFAASGE